MDWRVIAGDLLERAALRFRPRGRLSHEEVATALYRGILERDPDIEGLAGKAQGLLNGYPLEDIVRSFVTSAEFHSRFLISLLPPVQLPNLVAAMPERFETQQSLGGLKTVYVARDDADMILMAELIDKYRYYDRFGVWTPSIDLDKHVTAGIVQGLGASSCFELGCFTGPVLTLLAEAGVEVAGSEVSHLAFVFAYPNIRDRLHFGDLLSLQLDRSFDVILCMDVLEHISPLLVDAYIRKILSMLAPGGVLYLNAPMWGSDRVFGVVEDVYLDEWQAVGDASCWRHWPCEDDGWPIHGHLVWASPAWWERKMAGHGLVRDIPMETTIHRNLAAMFRDAPGRRSLFVLRREGERQSSDADLAAMSAALSAVPGLPAPV